MSDEMPEGGRDGISEAIGLVYDESGPELVRAHVEIPDTVLQPWGIVHGGVHSSIAESICSQATARAVWGDGMIAMGQSNYATFLRPISSGRINAVARRRHGGRTSWVWDVDLTDDDGRLCAIVRMTIAVRPRP
jgi:1,4-dihydroxy-2-naphthoyl-CoA hydrolase